MKPVTGFRPIRVIERVTRVTPLGIRFWDVATESPVRGKLIVTAQRPTEPERRFPLFANPSGIYVLQNVPGLRHFEYGTGDEQFWDEHGSESERPLTIEVRDPRQRFLPCRFNAKTWMKGLYAWECSEFAPVSGRELCDVPLYSAPNRAPPGGMAVLHANLRDPSHDPPTPAAWAVVEVSLEGRLRARGIADRDGKLTLIFPFPSPSDLVDDPLLETPTRVPLTAQTWSIQLKARYAHSEPAPYLPNLCETLGQPEATLWKRWGDATQREPLTESDLRYGQRKTLRTLRAGGGSELSDLYITAAG